MRKVLFSEHIPVEYVTLGGNKVRVSGTGCWGPLAVEGVFHQWGFESTDGGESVATDTVAIIELKDGTVKLMPPSKIRFVDYYPEEEKNGLGV